MVPAMSRRRAGSASGARRRQQYRPVMSKDGWLTFVGTIVVLILAALLIYGVVRLVGA